jgi:heterodisulfide reductase subunit A-like polyferredoxin
MTTTISITLVSACASEGHVTVSVGASDTGTRQFTYEVADLRASMNWAEADRIARDILRMHFRGLTNQQARSELQAGITVVI